MSPTRKAVSGSRGFTFTLKGFPKSNKNLYTDSIYRSLNTDTIGKYQLNLQNSGLDRNQTPDLLSHQAR